jgi:hypothetical protein
MVSRLPRFLRFQWLRRLPPPLLEFLKMTPNRNESFVPLAPASLRPAGERREFRATVISQSGQAQAFQSLSTTAAPSATSPAPQAGTCEPKVSLQRDGNRVTGIQIQCSCGQVIDLLCVYDAVQVTAVTQPAADPGRRDTGGPRGAAIPQAAPVESAPGKICKDSGKDLPASAKKKPKKA